uniref:Uncharacterized protein n=1 Tax=Romanomermis culicivorax TaxID=13658 RepID=A0A915IET7_ROMCU
MATPKLLTSACRDFSIATDSDVIQVKWVPVGIEHPKFCSEYHKVMMKIVPYLFRGAGCVFVEMIRRAPLFPVSYL